MGGKPSGGSNAAAEEQRQREAKRRANIMQGTQAIDSALAPFDDKYFQQRQQAYTDYAAPQLDQQYNDAYKQLIYALSRSNLTQSTEAANRQRALTEERARYERDIKNNAANFANSARSNLENTRSSLISQLNATEDPTSAATAAANQAGLLQAPPTFDPLGNFVFNAASNLENLSKMSTGGRGLFSGGPAGNIGSANSGGSSRVVR